MDLSGLEAKAGSLKKAETVVKGASLKAQQEGESVSALAGTNPVTAGIAAGVTLKKTETVEKQADLKEQLKGEKELGAANPMAAAIAAAAKK